MTRKRISEGYYLGEIQRALSVLHDRVWELAVRRSNISSLVLNLAEISRTIGAAKDDPYFAHKEEVEGILARSGVQAEELFKGADASPQA